MARTEPETDNNHPPSRTVVAEHSSIGPRVGLGEPKTRNPWDVNMMSVSDGEGISSVMRI